MIHADSIVFTEDAEATEAKSSESPTAPAKNVPTETISNPIDIDSIQFDDAPEAPRQSTFARLAEAAFSPFQAATKFAVEEGMKSGRDIDFRMNPDQSKAPDSRMVSDMTGIPHEDIEKHYDQIKFLSNLAIKGPAQAGFEAGLRVDPVTTKEIVDKTMTPALVAAAVANPVGTAAGLVAFTALDHIIPTSKFIPEGATASQEASIELMGMLAKGAVVGGLFHGFEKMTNPFQGFEKGPLGMTELLERHGFEKLVEQGLPKTITISPEQILAIEKNTRKNVARRENIVNTIFNNILERRKPDEALKAQIERTPELAREAKQRVVDHFNSIEAKTGKLRQGQKQILRDLQRELEIGPYAKKAAEVTDGLPNGTQLEPPAQEPVQTGKNGGSVQSVMETLGIDAKTAETALKNNLNVKVGAEKVLRVALESDENFTAFKEAMGPQKAIEGTGETKTRGLAAGVEAKAVEKKLTDGFGELPEYQVVNMKDQAARATELVKSDYEAAKRIAMGEQPAPEGLIPESVFMAVENKAILEGDTATLRGLATGSKLTTEATTMGQRIRTLAERDPESPTGAMKEVLKAREEAAQKRIGKKSTIAKEVQKVAGEIKRELQKVKQTKQTWSDFILELQC